jgi:hypothetical protein
VGRRFVGSATFLAALWMAPLPAAGQSKTKAEAYAAPRTEDGKPDLNGIWQTRGPIDADITARINGKNLIVDPKDGKIPYQAAAAAKQKQNFKDRATLDPVGKCYLPGVPRLMYVGQPFQIVQVPGFVSILSQFAHVVRSIPLNDSKHLENIDFWLGDPRGHWEGDTLVVDVTNFNDQTWFDAAGNFHSEALHVVERFTRTAADVITYEVTIEDPKVLTKPMKMTIPLYLHTEKNFQILEHECFYETEGPTVTEGTRPDPAHGR